MPELTDYPYEVLMVRPDYVEANPKIAMAVARAISRGGALFHSKPEEAKAALRAHRLSVKDISPEALRTLLQHGRRRHARLGNHERSGMAKGHKLFNRRGHRQRFVPGPVQ